MGFRLWDYTKITVGCQQRKINCIVPKKSLPIKAQLNQQKIVFFGG